MRSDRSLVVSTASDAHQRRDDRDVESLGELAQLGGRVAVDHAAAGVDQRPLRGAEQPEERFASRRRRWSCA